LRLSLGLTLKQRASGSFDPLTLSPAVLYDPSDLTTLFQASGGTGAVTASGDPVGYLGDKSGNAKNATQATDTRRPLYNLSGGLSSLRFDGVDDLLSGPAISNYITSSVFDIILAGKFNAVANNGANNFYAQDSIMGDSGGAIGLSAKTTGKLMGGVQDSGVKQVEDDYTIGQPFVAHLRLSGGTVSLTLNSRTTLTVGSVGAPWDMASLFALGRSYADAYTADCNLYALFANKTLLSAGELASVKTWAANKSGVTL
jgi:hypothetical protein